MSVPRALLIVGAAVDPEQIAFVCTRLAAVDASIAVAAMRPPADDALCGVELHELARAAEGRGPSFRRELRAVKPRERVWLHVRDDAWVAAQAARADVVVWLDAQAQVAARRLAEVHPHLSAVGSADEAISWLGQGATPRAPRTQDAPPRLRTRLQRFLPGFAPGRDVEQDVGGRVRALLARGEGGEAQDLARVAAGRATSLRERADLLGDVVSWELAHGRSTPLAREAYAAELAVADEHLAGHDYTEAAFSFQEAMRTAFHRTLHFDGPHSPLADDPAHFLAPLHRSDIGRALCAAERQPRPGRDDAGRRTRLQIITRKNDDFLGEIRAHFVGHPQFETRFADLLGAPGVEGLAKTPGPVVERLLSDGELRSVQQALQPYLEWADVMFIEWGSALAALVSRVDRGRTRVVVRMHSFELFTPWPQLMDLRGVDDVVFVSEHLRDLAVASLPGLRGPDAPRLHVIANAMELSRFRRPKPDGARFTLGVVGASKLVKDPRWAIEVLRRLRQHDARYRLVLIRGRFQDSAPGTKEYAEQLRRDLDELEPTGAVHVLSHTDDVPAALEEVGVVISSSVRESFHMGLVEGAASGAVPVVRDWPFFPGAAARLFPEDWVVATPDEAAQRILALTADEGDWRRTAAAASDHVLHRWDWPVVRSEFEQLFRTT
jgi:glycosyltransferase involved in cell wall biosynthesis